MTHLLILCEGKTEKYILESFLRPYWQVRFRSVEVQSYDSNQELRKNFKADAERQLTQELDSCVLCVFDLYQEPFGLYEPDHLTPAEGYTLIREQMYLQINTKFHPRFGAFPVVMEVETWLLADPVIQQLLSETINFPETIFHPYSFLRENYARRNNNYNKITTGALLFSQAAAQRVYEDNCPHFNHLIEWLVNPPNIANPSAKKIADAQAEWEKQRDEKYALFLRLESQVITDDDLEAAILAEKEYQAHLLTYEDIFK